MYDNIGGKIKGLAKWVCIIGSIIMAIPGISFIMQGEDFILVGILLLVLGPVICWISSWMLYGFGELIEKTSNIEQIVLSKECLNSEYILEKFYKGGIITEEEYNRYKVDIDQKSK